MTALRLLALAAFLAAAPAAAQDDDPLALLAALPQACADAAAASCQAARLALLSPVAAALRSLGASGAHDADAPRIRPFATAEHATLRYAAAAALGDLKPTRDDTAILTQLLNDPVPAVREAALAALHASEDPQAQALADQAWVPEDPGWAAEPSPVPPGLALPPEAQFLRFASAPAEGVLAYATALPPEKVVRWFEAAAGRPALELDALAAAYPTDFGTAAGAENPMQRIQELATRMATMSFAEQMAVMQEMAALQAQLGELNQDQLLAALTPAEQMPATAALERWRNAALFEAPRAVVLDEADGRLGRYVVVYRDLTLETTGFAVQSAAPALSAEPAPIPPQPATVAAEDPLDALYWATVEMGGGIGAARYLELFPDGAHRAEAAALLERR